MNLNTPLYIPIKIKYEKYYFMAQNRSISLKNTTKNVPSHDNPDRIDTRTVRKCIKSNHLDIF